MALQQYKGINDIFSRPYRTLNLEWHSSLALLRVKTRVLPVPCYTLEALGELLQLFADISATQRGTIRQFVMSSAVKDVFSFGGDLSLFVQLIRSRDRDKLTSYGTQCIDLIWWMLNAPQLGIHTIALVEGDALGGGLEAALAFNYIIFSETARAGFPEVLFNLFPGMGGWHLASRRSSFLTAKELILSGHMYTAADLHSLGLVDRVAKAGECEAALETVTNGVHDRLAGTVAALKAWHVAAPITYESLKAVVEQWVDAALAVTDRDLRKMSTLARAQLRKVAGHVDGAVEAARKMELEGGWVDEGRGLQRTGVTGFGDFPGPSDPLN